MNIDANPSPEELLEFKQAMKQIEEDRKNAVIPNDVSLDFAMSEDNLYAIWSTATENMRLIDPTSEVQLNWTLASEDTKKAFNEISAQHDDNKLLAFIKFSDLRNIVQQISSDSIWQKITQSFNNLYFVENNGRKYWTQQNEGQTLLKGKLSDIKTLYQE